MDWLPNGHTIESYISSCLTLLEEWKWLIEEKNTNILKAEVLDKPPATDIIPFISGLDVKELNEIPYGLIKDEWPESLKKFVLECCCLRLNLPKQKIKESVTISGRLFRKMNPKKIEEVISLSALTAGLCLENNIKHVIDIGSGLGYVDRILYQHYGLTVLGLEKDPEKVKKAKELEDGVDYEEAFLSEETMPGVKITIKAWLQGSPACFIALHGCGDLSVLIGGLFGEVEEGKVLILVPCCYHRSAMRPLSPEIKRAGLVNTTLLRLASDGTAERWRLTSAEEHLAHARSALSRALIQVFPSDDSADIKKKHRHLLRSVVNDGWEKCLNKCIEGFTGVDSEKLQEAWKNNEWRLNQIEAFTCLQVCFQAVAEGLIITDLFLFLTSKRRANVKLMRIFDVIVSPRSVAFVVTP